MPAADDYAGWAEQVAASEKTPFLDLNEMIAQRYDALGPDKVEPLFGDPHTHTSLAGAELNSVVVVEGLGNYRRILSASIWRASLRGCGRIATQDA